MTDTKQKYLKIKQRLIDHLATKSHKVKLIIFLNEHTQKPVRTQIEIAANNQGLSFKTQQEKKLTRKRRIETLLKGVNFLQVTESPNHHLAQLQIHDEELKPGSTTRGSYTHGNSAARAVLTLSDLVKLKVKEKIADADAIGIQMDESTDTTKKKVLIP